MRVPVHHFVLVILLLASELAAAQGSLAMDSIAGGEWRFDGELGRRVDANVENWLLRAPGANPGLLEMFHRRDRHLPYAEPVPWAGEFAGKYLISAVQACRMTDDERLRPFVQDFVNALIKCQAEDGYIGPWPEDERLLGHWDLWGHYHVMLGLLAWHDEVDDADALAAAIRAADLICDIYVDGDRRPIDAGTPQINLAVIHVMGDLYRRTKDERYRELMARIEVDMQKDGDWLRLGAEGLPYHKLPGGGTRWESLHIIQGIIELYRITGEERYKTAAVNLWESIRDYDVHPSGAFSTHESAIGTIYERGSIETCCSVAWQALSIDILKLTGDPAVADELERTTWNQVLAAQHPSGNWWTYDTPMDGTRAPSYHQINFQYRPGTPELNCCSVNAPRGLGMLSEWAVMRDEDGLVVNFFGPSTFTVPLDDGTIVTIRQRTKLPAPDHERYKIDFEISCEPPKEFTIKFRTPSWASSSWASSTPSSIRTTQRGDYVVQHGMWGPDEQELRFEYPIRANWILGEDTRYGHGALQAGPTLLAFDARYNNIETADLPKLRLDVQPVPATNTYGDRNLGSYAPMTTWQVESADGQILTLVDFATAGAHGTGYVAWLPVADPPPPAVKLLSPKDGAEGKPGPLHFRWSDSGDPDVTYRLEISRRPTVGSNTITDEAGNRVQSREINLPPGEYYWRVVSMKGEAAKHSRGKPRMFRISEDAERTFPSVREDGLMAAVTFSDVNEHDFGEPLVEHGLTPAEDRHGNADGAVRFDGTSSKLQFELPYFPDEAYTFAAWVCPEGLPVGAMEQVFSAWCMGMDDPLRVSLRGDEISAGMEAGQGFRTEGVPLENGKWVHVAAVKDGSRLTLFIDGEATHSVDVPARISTQSEIIGLGHNPLFHGDEYFDGKLDDFVFYARALTADEVAELAM